MRIVGVKVVIACAGPTKYSFSCPVRSTCEVVAETRETLDGNAFTLEDQYTELPEGWARIKFNARCPACIDEGGRYDEE